MKTAMLRWLPVLAVCFACGCEDGETTETTGTTTETTSSSTTDETTSSSDTTTSTEEAGPCLDRPTDLPRPPTGQLPCELYPPGF